jgi:hypothetical protein
LSMQEIDLPEVQKFQQRARFFKDGDGDFVEISYVGSKDTNVLKVTPQLMAQYRSEWTAYCDGSPLKIRPGTPLTALHGLDQVMADKYIAQNVHTVEELAVLNDMQCQSLGHGTLTFRKQAG